MCGGCFVCEWLGLGDGSLRFGGYQYLCSRFLSWEVWHGVFGGARVECFELSLVFRAFLVRTAMQ